MLHLFKVAPEQATRTFKTARFTKAARKTRIADAELCEAIAEVMKGQADDLGGGVYKKRLSRNLHRSIIIAKGGRYWFYASRRRTGQTSAMTNSPTFELWRKATLC